MIYKVDQSISRHTSFRNEIQKYQKQERVRAYTKVKYEQDSRNIVGCRVLTRPRETIHIQLSYDKAAKSEQKLSRLFVSLNS